MPFLDERFRTVASRDARGVFGKSSGGYGALRMGMLRADVFSAVACHSGDAAFALCYLPGFARTAARIAKAGSVAQWVEEFEAVEKKRSSDFDAINTFGMAAAYSPDPDKPFGVGLPFDLESGELLPDVWRRWRENDPVNMVRCPEHADALRSLKLLFLDCGSEDEFQLHLGMRLFVKRLEEAGVSHVVEEFPDDHRSISYRYEASIPRLARVLSA